MRSWRGQPGWQPKGGESPSCRGLAWSCCKSGSPSLPVHFPSLWSSPLHPHPRGLGSGGGPPLWQRNCSKGRQESLMVTPPQALGADSLDGALSTTTSCLCN